MTFISYAQNYEDVMLWRALGKIAEGFYVDVGAYDPLVDSVTKAFYDRGWRGVNIEPICECYKKFMADRPEDANLNVAISDTPGVMIMHKVVGATGLSTFDNTLFNHYRTETNHELQDASVRVLTLDTVLDQYGRVDIHFLKVDVEGWERQVFNSISLNRLRPWIIVAEGTYVESWEPLLTNRDYSFVYFDGLNHFYVANERIDLKDSFNAPPNVFDDFVRVREYEAIAARAQSEAALHAAKQELRAVQAAAVSIRAAPRTVKKQVPKWLGKQKRLLR